MVPMAKASHGSDSASDCRGAPQRRDDAGSGWGVSAEGGRRRLPWRAPGHGSVVWLGARPRRRRPRAASRPPARPLRRQPRGGRDGGGGGSSSGGGAPAGARSDWSVAWRRLWRRHVAWGVPRVTAAARSGGRGVLGLAAAAAREAGSWQGGAGRECRRRQLWARRLAGAERHWLCRRYRRSASWGVLPRRVCGCV